MFYVKHKFSQKLDLIQVFGANNVLSLYLCAPYEQRRHRFSECTGFRTFPAARIAIEGFPYFAAGIIFFILNVAIIGYYQSIEQVKRATVMVFLRGLVFLLPSFIMLPKLLGIPGIWLAMPLAEALTLAVITYILLAKK